MKIMFNPISICESVLYDILSIKGHTIIPMSSDDIADIYIITPAVYLSHDYDWLKSRSPVIFIGDDFPSYINRVPTDNLIETYTAIIADGLMNNEKIRSYQSEDYTRITI